MLLSLFPQLNTERPLEGAGSARSPLPSLPLHLLGALPALGPRDPTHCLLRGKSASGRAHVKSQRRGLAGERGGS